MVGGERKGEWAMVCGEGHGARWTGRWRALLAWTAGAALLAGCERVPGNETDVAATSARPAAAAGSFPTGRWRMTTTVQNVQITAEDPVATSVADAMRAQLVGKPQVKEVCVTAEQVERGLLELNAGQDDCTTDRNVVSDGRIDVALTCRGEDKAVATVRNAGRYDAANFASESSVKVVQTGGPGTMTIKATTQGRRLGDC